MFHFIRLGYIKIFKYLHRFYQNWLFESFECSNFQIFSFILSNLTAWKFSNICITLIRLCCTKILKSMIFFLSTAELFELFHTFSFISINLVASKTIKNLHSFYQTRLLQILKYLFNKTYCFKILVYLKSFDHILLHEDYQIFEFNWSNSTAQE